jgi:amino acid transporter
MNDVIQDQPKGKSKLARNLGLLDVYSISTGAMFSSGLFLLPGIAAASTGNSVFLAYGLAGFLILPAMYCMAELTTAMPKAGGTYYFLDRSMGPFMGTIGGLGSWAAVVFKSAFALVGMGAYLSLYLDIPFAIMGMLLAIAFGIINTVGAKETTLLQRILVVTLVIILVGFTALGVSASTKVGGPLASLNPDYGDFFKTGLVGFVSTIGLVFVSYAGLTKVASVAEEVKNPDRNIPLGMTLSLVTATVLYTLGTFVLIKLLPPEELYASLTPIADATRVFAGNWPMDIGVILIVVAAIAAFASTGNAGIMSASRYPYAMAKDKLMPESFGVLGRYQTPTFSIVVTVIAIILVIAMFDVASVAKLASAFQLLLFILVCAAVIVMRESKIPTYRPGFKVPLYPWMPILGILIGFWLIIEMGVLAIGFTGMVIIACGLWYRFYAAKRVERRGAIFHVHERLGRNIYEGLEHELMTIIHDRTVAQNLSYETVVARAVVTDFRYGAFDLDQLRTTIVSSQHIGVDEDKLTKIVDAGRLDFRPIGTSVQLLILSDEAIEEPNLTILRFGPNVRMDADFVASDDIHTAIILFCPPKPVGLDMRIAGHLAEIVQGEGFDRRWLAARSDAELNDVLVRDDHFLHAPIEDLPSLQAQIGERLDALTLPESCIVALVERGTETLIAQPDIVLEAGDLVALIGEPEMLNSLRKQEGSAD